MIVAESVSNVDDILGEMFLEEKEPTNDDIKVTAWLTFRIVVSCCLTMCISAVVHHLLILAHQKKIKLDVLKLGILNLNYIFLTISASYMYRYLKKKRLIEHIFKKTIMLKVHRVTL